MNIALCDDEKIFIDDLKHLLDQVSFKNDIDLHIDVFYSGEEFLQFMSSSDMEYDIIFLDILMKKLNGIETSKEIRLLNKNVNIVFLTSTIEFAIDGYDVHALNYLIKPANYEKLQEIILDIYNDKNSEDKMFTFNANHILHKVALDDINYFEINNRIVYINSIKDESIKNVGFYQKLDDLEMQLEPNNFIRSHRSYLINIKNVKSISTKEIIFTNGETALVSKRHYKVIKDKLLEHLSNLV